MSRVDQNRGEWALSAAASEVITVSVTCRVDERAHAVPDTELTASAAADAGCYQAVCGHLVSPAPMVEPDGRPCVACSAAVSSSNGRRKRTRRSRFSA